MTQHTATPENISMAKLITKLVADSKVMLEALKYTLEVLREEVNDPIEWAELLDDDRTAVHKLNQAINQATNNNYSSC